jgi:hypothetical protein
MNLNNNETKQRICIRYKRVLFCLVWFRFITDLLSKCHTLKSSKSYINFAPCLFMIFGCSTIIRVKTHFSSRAHKWWSGASIVANIYINKNVLTVCSGRVEVGFSDVIFAMIVICNHQSAGSVRLWSWFCHAHERLIERKREDPCGYCEMVKRCCLVGQCV